MNCGRSQLFSARNIALLKRYSQAHVANVKIYEVGPRDGLQNEAVIVPASTKIEFIDKLSETGLKIIETTSFVSPKWIPQMADNSEVFRGITKKPDVDYPVLVPNMKGLEAALSAGAKEVAIFASASDGFSRKNVNCTAEEGLKAAAEVAEAAKENFLKVRGYISCIVGCPYDGAIKPSVVARCSDALFDMGCYEVSLGDTIGVGTKNTMTSMLLEVLKVAPPKNYAIHCHDTYGQALVNVCVAMDHGIDVVDASVAGLGGCPYALGATGNVATEDVVYMLEGMGVKTGLDLRGLIEAGQFITKALKKKPESRVNNALYKKYQL